MKLLITGAISWGQKEKNELEKKGHELIYVQDERIPLREQGIDSEDIEGIIGNGLFLYNEITKFTNLKYIQLTSAGFDRVPMDYIREHMIEIHNAKGVYSIPMAEFAVCGVLQIYKQSRFFYENQKEHHWTKHRGLIELAGKVVCIVGCGSVGTECAKRFHAFGCKVLGVDLFPRDDEHYDSMKDLSFLDDILPKTDILVLTLPLTKETNHLINESKFVLIKQNMVLVNIARGAVVDAHALIQNIDKIGGLVLDVFEEEPLEPNNPLWEMENAIITPHNSFVGDNNQERLKRVIFENLGIN